MRYEQIITIYGRIVVEAESKKDAQDKIMGILQEGIKFDGGELIIGDFERESDVERGDEI